MAEDRFDEAAAAWADNQRSYAKLVARYWADERFRAEVQRDPAAALRWAGMEVPEGQRVKIVEVADDETVLPIPTAQPKWEEQVAASHTFGTRGTFACVGTIASCGPNCLGSLFCMGSVFTFGCATAAEPESGGEEPPPAKPGDPTDLR